jgi:hypothetical protein
MQTVCNQKVKNLCEPSRAVIQGANTRLDENIVNSRQAPLTALKNMHFITLHINLNEVDFEVGTPQ